MTQFYPIGTVVRLAAPENRLFLIAGYFPKTPDKKHYDYFGVAFPLGMMRDTDFICFYHNAVTEVLHRGFCDESGQKFLTGLETMEQNMQAAAQVLGAAAAQKNSETGEKNG